MHAITTKRRLRNVTTAALARLRRLSPGSEDALDSIVGALAGVSVFAGLFCSAVVAAVA